MKTARKRHLFGVMSSSVQEDRQLVGRIRKRSAPTSTGVEAEAEAPDRFEAFARSRN
jgi:hypothetical protein